MFSVWVWPVEMMTSRDGQFFRSLEVETKVENGEESFEQRSVSSLLLPAFLVICNDV